MMPLETTNSPKPNATSRSSLFAAVVVFTLGFFAASILLRRRIRAAAPDWTDNQQHDPGITILSLLGFLVESLSALFATVSRRAQRLFALLTASFERK